MLKELPQFVDEMLGKIEQAGIDVYNFELDHFAYQAESMEDYENQKKNAFDKANFLEEQKVGDIYVAFYELSPKIYHRKFEISALEVISPYPDKENFSGLTHIEFVIPSFKLFVNKYADLQLNTKAMDRKIFPKIKYDFGDGTDVRFHEKNILEEL